MYDAIIAGGGPAGLTASMYIGRANKEVLVIDKGRSLLEKSQKIENYPGFPEGIGGSELISRFETQAKKFGIKITREEVLSVEQKEDYFSVETDESQYKGRGIIIATGVSYKKPKIKNIDEFTGRGVSYCATCDGPFFKNKKVFVIGSKNFAAKEALELLDHTTNITIYTNGKALEMDEKFISQLREKEIPLKKEKIKKITGGQSVDALILQNGEKIKCDGVFVALGDLGATDIARQLGILTEDNFITVDEYNKTNLDKVFAAGDCTGGNLQLSIAVGEGANAALNLLADLSGRSRGQMKDY